MIDMEYEYDYNMSARIFGARLPVPSSHVRHNGERMQTAVLAPVLIRFIVIMLKPPTYITKK